MGSFPVISNAETLKCCDYLHILLVERLNMIARTHPENGIIELDYYIGKSLWFVVGVPINRMQFRPPQPSWLVRLVCSQPHLKLPLFFFARFPAGQLTFVYLLHPELG